MTLYLNRLLPLGAMLGGGLTIFLVYLLSYRKYQGISPARLIVTGVGVSTMLSGIMISLMTSQEQGKLDAVVNWLSGRVTGDDWTWLMMLAPLLVLVWLLTFSRGRALNIMNLNDQTAMALGLELQKERLRALVLSTILAALSVLLVGNITFVGLLAGHTARKLVGGDHRFLIPASLLLGAILLLVADTIGRLLLVGTGIPTGLIVSIIGAPFFLYLLIKHQ